VVLGGGGEGAVHGEGVVVVVSSGRWEGWMVWVLGECGGGFI
jgi:hypothetical protein